MTVAELLARMDSDEMTEWIAYAQLDPFGSVRGDLQAGVIASTVANASRDPKKRRQPFEPKDFLLQFAAEGKREKTPDELLAKVKNLAKLFGHKLTTGKP